MECELNLKEAKNEATDWKGKIRDTANVLREDLNQTSELQNFLEFLDGRISNGRALSFTDVAKAVSTNALNLKEVQDSFLNNASDLMRILGNVMYSIQGNSDSNSWLAGVTLLEAMSKTSGVIVSVSARPAWTNANDVTMTTTAEGVNESGANCEEIVSHLKKFVEDFSPREDNFLNLNQVLLNGYSISRDVDVSCKRENSKKDIQLPFKKHSSVSEASNKNFKSYENLFDKFAPSKSNSRNILSASAWTNEEVKIKENLPAERRRERELSVSLDEEFSEGQSLELEDIGDCDEISCSESEEMTVQDATKDPVFARDVHEAIVRIWNSTDIHPRYFNIHEVPLHASTRQADTKMCHLSFDFLDKFRRNFSKYKLFCDGQKISSRKVSVSLHLKKEQAFAVQPYRDHFPLTFCCPECGFVTDTLFQLTYHASESHQVRLHACMICAQIVPPGSDDIKRLRECEASHFPFEILSSDKRKRYGMICFNCFKNSETTGERSIKYFTTKKRLLEHIQRYCGKTSNLKFFASALNDEDCTQESKKLTKSHKEVQESLQKGQFKFLCSTCNREFFSYNEKLKHFAENHPGKVYRAYLPPSHLAKKHKDMRSEPRGYYKCSQNVCV